MKSEGSFLENKQGIILVCIDEHPRARFLLRAAKRKAQELELSWEVLHVETSETENPTGEEAHIHLLQTLTLAEQMGAKVHTIDAPTAYQGIIKFLKEQGVNSAPIEKIILGKTEFETWLDYIIPPLPYRLKKQLKDKVDIIAIPFEGGNEHKRSLLTRLGNRNVRLKEVIYSLSIVALTTLVIEIIDFLLPDALGPYYRNKSILYIIPSIVAAGKYGLVTGLITAVTSFLVLTFLYIAPPYSLIIEHLSDAINLAMFLGASMASTLFMSRTHAKGEEIAKKAHRVQALFQLHRVTFTKDTRANTIDALYEELVNLLEMEVAFFLPSAVNIDQIELVFPEGISLSEAETLALETSWREGKITGLGSPSQSEGKWRFIPLITTNDAIGVLGVRINHPFHLDNALAGLLNAITDQVALILERMELGQMMEESRLREEREKLRSMLLSSVSHDLKTPLASIIGSLSVLLSMSSRLTEEHRNTLMRTALEESQRLDSFITNILDMTCIESGQISFRQEWVNPDEIFRRVQRRLRDRLQYHVLILHPLKEKIEVMMDPMMTEQVVQNVLDNGAKYTPPGTKIEISCFIDDKGFTCEIRDHGPGIPSDKLEKVFDKYARIHKQDRQVAGTGLGLAISKAVMQAQSGNIKVANHPEGGAVFTLYLPKWRLEDKEKQTE